MPRSAEQDLPSDMLGDPAGLVGLDKVMALTAGHRDVRIGLIDGPVKMHHPGLQSTVLVVGRDSARCGIPEGNACRHGTFIAGVLAARRGERAPAIAPNCTLLARPVFRDGQPSERLPSARPAELADAIADCVDAGAWVVNLSVGLTGRDRDMEGSVHAALENARAHGVLVVAAAGNQAAMTSTALTGHSWVIPAVAYRDATSPLPESNVGRTVGTRGLGAPGWNVLSLSPGGPSVIASGTSVAAAFITGTAALLWSLFPRVSAAQLKWALVTSGQRRTRVVPPLLDAWRAYSTLYNVAGARSLP